MEAQSDNPIIILKWFPLIKITYKSDRILGIVLPQNENVIHRSSIFRPQSIFSYGTRATCFS